MDELINQVAAKTGLPADKAKATVDQVIAFIKEKLPEPLRGQIDGFLSGGGGNLGDIAGKIGGMFGGKQG
jgi:hypothetical protein